MGRAWGTFGRLSVLGTILMFFCSNLQPFSRFICIMARWQIGPKDWFVFFVVLFDKFDHFGQTFGVINVSIDRLNLKSPKEERRDTSFKDRTPNQYFWLKLADSIVFYGVFSNSSVQKRPEMFAKKKSAATRNFLDRYFRNFDFFFVDDIVFFQNLKNCREKV
jgi:hypothetical protein